jgi:predicted nucleic acid-binding protein
VIAALPSRSSPERKLGSNRPESRAQRGLAQHSRHRVSIPDLLIAACAHQHGADVLHRDRHYDTLATFLAFQPIRV